MSAASSMHVEKTLSLSYRITRITTIAILQKKDDTEVSSTQRRNICLLIALHAVSPALPDVPGELRASHGGKASVADPPLGKYHESERDRTLRP